MKTLVVAIGGNSLIKNAQHMNVPDRYIEFLERGGREALITSSSALSAALEGQNGTRILK